MRRNNIETERWKMQMTKSQMCEKLGVTLKTYNSYINDGMIPSTALLRLRDITGCSIDYLLGVASKSDRTA